MSSCLNKAWMLVLRFYLKCNRPSQFNLPLQLLAVVVIRCFMGPREVAPEVVGSVRARRFHGKVRNGHTQVLGIPKSCLPSTWFGIFLVFEDGTGIRSCYLSLVNAAVSSARSSCVSIGKVLDELSGPVIHLPLRIPRGKHAGASPPSSCHKDGCGQFFQDGCTTSRDDCQQTSESYPPRRDT